MEFVAVDVTRQALGVSYPDEIEDLDAAVERFERAARARFLPPVRMGVEMLPLADHLLPVVAALLGAMGGALAEQAATLLSERTKALMARRRGHPVLALPGELPACRDRPSAGRAGGVRPLPFEGTKRLTTSS
ncbi:hypothetical protein [Kitasatospora sp. P5_F3]